MDQERDSLTLQNLCRFARPLGTIRRNTYIQCLALPHSLHQRTHGFFQRNIDGRPVGVKNVDILESHARQAFVQGRKQIFARAARAVGARPHIPPRFCRNQKFISVAAEIVPKNLSEVLLGRAVRRPVVIRQIEMRHAAIESAPNHCPACLEDVDASEVLPQSKRNGGQDNSRSSTPIEWGSVISLCIRYITHRISFSFRPTRCCSSSTRKCPESLSSGVRCDTRHTSIRASNSAAKLVGG